MLIIKITTEARNDFNRLDKGMKNQVLKGMYKVSQNPLPTPNGYGITSKCNERCVHCYIPHENKVSDIEPDLFYDILNQCKNMKLLHLTLSGGESMLHKKFCDFLQKMQRI